MPAPFIPIQEADSFSALFSRTHLLIFRFIYGIHGGPTADVEDLTAETYSRAWRSRAQFSGTEHDALCWLYTIARHLVIDALRSEHARPSDPTEDLDELNINATLAPAQTTPEDQTIQKEQLARMWRGLHRLSLPKREILVLRYILGWQVKEVASFLQMEDNTVSVTIRRSLEQIRSEWSD